MHPSSYNHMRELLARLDRARPLAVLDVGSADINGTYRPLVAPPWTYIGYDRQAGPNVDLAATRANEIPLQDGSVDVVISGQCLEHVEEPWLLALEMGRVLRPGGWAFWTAPWKWALHHHPLDCWRILPDGMAVLMRIAGLVEVKTYTIQKDCWGVGRRL